MRDTHGCRLALAAGALALILATSACGSDETATESAAATTGTTTLVGFEGLPPSSSTTVLTITLAPDAPDGDVVLAPVTVLDYVNAYPEVHSEVLGALAAQPTPVLAHVNMGGGSNVSINGPLPDDVRGGRSQKCMHIDVVYLDASGEELVYVPAGLCGQFDTDLVFEFGPHGVEIADRRFIDGTPEPSAPGTVAIDRPAARGRMPGEAIEVVLDPVPADQIAPPLPHLEEWPSLRPFVCFDVTVRSGAAAGQVVPAVVISQGGEPVPVPEPTDQSQPRVIAQDPESTVVWSFGPIDMDEHQPDSITVTASEGEIASWDVSARHC